MTRRIRALVVEDSLTVRRWLVEIIAADPDLEVVGEATDGDEAIALTERLRPDVLTLDMVLGATTGLRVTEHIMAFCPTPILIVSASMNRGEVASTFDALAAGAVDVLDKPRADGVAGVWERDFVSAIKRVSRIRVITHPRARLNSPAPRRGSAAASRVSPPRVVAIGASTGGPGALAHILRALPPAFPVPILIVLHIGEPFAAPFCDWLGGLSPLPVVLATDGMRLPEVGEPRAVLAPADRHLVVRGGRLELTSEAERHSCRPSVDVLFESVAHEVGAAAVGCLLTGMGKDGAVGLLAMRRAGGATIAQDEATSIVFGMPREATLLGAAERVLPLDQIASTLVALAGRAAS